MLEQLHLALMRPQARASFVQRLCHARFEAHADEARTGPAGSPQVRRGPACGSMLSPPSPAARISSSIRSSPAPCRSITNCTSSCTVARRFGSAADSISPSKRFDRFAAAAGTPVARACGSSRAPVSDSRQTSANGASRASCRRRRTYARRRADRDRSCAPRA